MVVESPEMTDRKKLVAMEKTKTQAVTLQCSRQLTISLFDPFDNLVSSIVIALQRVDRR